jgi:L-histidine N-alpha-methyltransferase
MRTSNLAYAVAADPLYEFAAEVRAGLTRRPQKELPSKYLYDKVGSALFEVICELPEYGLTRADERLLQRNACAMVANIPDKVVVAELGSGSGRKTRRILEALQSREQVH